MKISLYLILVISCTFPAFSRADTSASTTFTSIGNSECTVWTDRRKEAASEKTFSFSAAWYLEGWILGSINTINALQHGNPDILKAIDGATIFLWVDRYCAENPKSDLLDASFSLSNKLTDVLVTKHKKKFSIR